MRMILSVVVDAPADELRMQARADAEDDIGFCPQLVTGWERQAEIMAAINNAMAHAVGDDGSAERLG